ncbi:hypothetical protein [Sandarakinorhabdus limnophila]|uniref:hypothetical protein n=1 Tax=Sandarakinorhabdus limnophila TaxID=210512 RepID=UPI0026F1CD93|nr:hypothetical protein [Sandarakinorhabdus limnophila]
MNSTIPAMVPATAGLGPWAADDRPRVVIEHVLPVARGTTKFGFDAARHRIRDRGFTKPRGRHDRNNEDFVRGQRLPWPQARQVALFPSRALQNRVHGLRFTLACHIPDALLAPAAIFISLQEPQP